MCERVLEKDENSEKLKKSFNPMVTLENEGYFLKIAGDFSRYMTECSDCYLSKKEASKLYEAVQKRTIRNMKL